MNFVEKLKKVFKLVSYIFELLIFFSETYETEFFYN